MKLHKIEGFFLPCVLALSQVKGEPFVSAGDERRVHDSQTRPNGKNECRGKYLCMHACMHTHVLLIQAMPCGN